MDRYGVWGAQISTPINRQRPVRLFVQFGGYQGPIHINVILERTIFVPECRFLFVRVSKTCFRACGNEWEACEGL